MGNGLTSISNNLFNGCERLFNVNVPDSVETIGSYAFSGCYLLSKITLGDGVTSIGSYSFNNCGLVSITIPVSVTVIGSRAFYNVKRITYKGTVAEWHLITLRNSWYEGYDILTVQCTDGKLTY